MTLHEKINFKSHFRPKDIDSWFMRANRPVAHRESVYNPLIEFDKPRFGIHAGNRNDMPFFALGFLKSQRQQLLK